MERDVIVQAANARAEQIVNKARREADGIRRDADKYVFDSLSRLYRELERIMTQVHNGIVMVEKDLMKNKASVDEVPRQPPPMSAAFEADLDTDDDDLADEESETETTESA